MLSHIKAITGFIFISVLVLVLGIVLGVLMWGFYILYWSAVWVSCCFHKDWNQFYKTWKDRVLESIF